MTDIALRPFTRDEFDTAGGLLRLALLFEGRPEDAEVFADGFEFDRSLAAFLAGRMVGTAAAYSFELTVPGATVPAAGVTIVTVHPAHRRRGVLTAMIGRQLSDLYEHGEPVAVLRASEASIYGRFGYAPATRELVMDLDRAAAGLRADVGSATGPELDLLSVSAGRDRMAAVYDAVRPGVPGFVARSPSAWAHHLHDPQHQRAEASALRVAVVDDGDGGAGYALYRVRDRWRDGLPAGQVLVEELIATAPAASAALWRHVLDIDLTAAVQITSRPLEEPLLAMLADPRRARPREQDGLWLRLVRLDEALTVRRYAAPVDLVLEVSDARCGWNAGRWRLAADQNGASCERSTAAPDLRLDVSVLAAGYLGDPVLGGYAAAGRIGELRPGAVRRLATALAWTPGPWCPHHF